MTWKTVKSKQSMTSELDKQERVRLGMWLEVKKPGVKRKT